MNKCFNCQGNLVKTTVNKSLDNKIVIESLPAHHCKKCDTFFYDEDAYEYALKKVKSVKQYVPQKILTKIRMLIL